MDQVHVVRHKVLVEGQQIRKVAREMGIARNTVKRFEYPVHEDAALPRVRATTQARAHEDERSEVVRAGEHLGVEWPVGPGVCRAASRVGGVLAMVEGRAGAAQTARAGPTLARTWAESRRRRTREGGA